MAKSNILTVSEMKRCKKVIADLIETLTITVVANANYAKKHSIPLPTHLSFLISEARRLIEELTGESFNLDYDRENKLV